MKNCTACGNSQENGKFCGKCGEPLHTTDIGEQVSATTETISLDNGNYSTPPTPPVQPSEHIEKVKATSKMYWSYFINYLKNPSMVFASGNREFMNGIISILVYAVIVGFALYGFVKSITSSIFGNIDSLFSNEYTGPSFFSIFSSSVIFILIAILIVLLSLFIIGKAFGAGNSWRELISYFGVHVLPVIVLSLFALFLILIKSYLYGNILLTISFVLILTVIPFYIISRLLSFNPKGMDSFYGYLLYIVLFVVLFSIFISVIADSTIGQYLEYFTEY